MSNKKKIINEYKKAFLKNGISPKAVLWPKGRQDQRFKKLLKPILNKEVEISNIMDFGCGLGHLSHFLVTNKLAKIKYYGADICADFVKSCKDRNINAMLVKGAADIKSNYDVIVCSGVFNLRYNDNDFKNQEIVFKEIKKLLSRTRKFLSVDFMRKDVDFEQKNAWHQPIEKLVSELENLCRRVEVDFRFFPYEYTIIFFK